MILISALLALFAIGLLLPALSDLWSALAILWNSLTRASAPRGRVSMPAVGHEVPRLLFLIPAHNEEQMIGQCVRSLQELDYPHASFHVTVIADNCTDGTARIVRATGAECLERTEPALRGKPRAIAWALERLPLASFDAVAIVDADTIVDRGFAKGLASAAPLREKAVQGYNGVSNPDENALTRMASVFADAKCRGAYHVKGLARLNVPVRLGGCIGTSVIAQHGWQAFSIGEDWELYAQLTAWGVPIQEANEARVYAQEASALKQSGPQRQRWTAGKYSVLRSTAGAVLSSTRIGVHQKLDVIAELSAPGPVVHAGVAAALAAIIAGMRLPGTAILLSILAAGVARHAIYATSALMSQPSPLRSAMAFAFLPVYALWRVPVEFAALRLSGTGPWVRTERHESAVMAEHP